MKAQNIASRITSLLACATLTTGGLQAQTVTEQVSGSTSGLVAISAVSESVVWASGGRGTVLRSINGGTTWEKRPVPGATTIDFRDIHALSADVAWILSIGNGPSSRIYHTTDGGANWTLQFTNTDSLAFYDCITMFDQKTGVAFSDAPDAKLRILRTEDGGEHWTLLPTDKLPAALKDEGGFASSGGCVVSSGKKAGWIAAGTPASRVFRTTNAGRNWQVSSTPLLHADAAGLTAVAFRDAKNGIAVASRINVPLDTSSNVVATTKDGGKTWTMRKRPPPGAIYGVVWAPGLGKETAVASTLGGLMLTRNGGDSWTALTGNFRYWAVASAGKSMWGVGPGGRITRITF